MLLSLTLTLIVLTLLEVLFMYPLGPAKTEFLASAVYVITRASPIKYAFISRIPTELKFRL